MHFAYNASVLYKMRDNVYFLDTGIAICMAAAVKGYPCIITMPEHMSKEKVNFCAPHLN